MGERHDNSLTIGEEKGSEIVAALRLVFQHLEADEQNRQFTTALLQIAASTHVDQKVLSARRSGKLVGATWLQIRPGRVAALWPPALVADEPESTAVALIESALDAARISGVRFVQSLLGADAGKHARWLRQCGFAKVADVFHLVCPRSAFPYSLPASELQFLPFDDSQDHRTRLAALVQRTYEQSHDCPSINGLRTAEEALEAYRAVGNHDPSRWFLVQRAECDVGCLLLAEHPEDREWELTYMGVVPELRGRGFGLQFVRYAQFIAGQTEVDRLTLAVDAANEPALTVYSAVGFETQNQCSLFLHVIKENCTVSALQSHVE